MRVADAILKTSWAITPDALQTILAVVNREGTDAMLERALEKRELRREAVAAIDGRPLDDTQLVTMRDGIAVLAINGPIVRYADFFTEVSGLTSIDTLARDFTRAVNDAQVTGILLNIDSPGGGVNGTHEFASMVYAARGTKPIHAYISDSGASGAYWIASAADTITAAHTAVVGSIGVVIAMRDPAKQNSRDVEFVSSQSPNKRPNPATESGRAEIQRLADDLADVFVASVALHRGVSEETVLSDFGRGGLLVGQAAVDAGLIDQLGSFEGVLADMHAATPPRQFGIRGTYTQESSMAPREETKPVAAQTTSSNLVNPTIGQPAAAVTLTPAPMVSSAPPATQDEVAELRAALAKERTARIKSEAEGFFATQFAAHKVLPGEKTAIVEAYTLVASELDERGVKVMESMFASRPAHTLTSELIPVGQDATVLANLPKTPKPEDADAARADADARAWQAKQNGHAPVKGG